MKVAFVLSLLLFLSAGLLIFTNHQGAALKIFIVSFWILVLGVFIYVGQLKGRSEE